MVPTSSESVLTAPRGGGARVAEDVTHAPREIAGRGRRRATDGARAAMTAHREDAGGIFTAVVSVLEHGFVAGAFTLFDHLPAYPPDRGVKPEQRLDQAVNAGLEIVAARDVFVLVREHRVHLRSESRPSNAAGSNTTG